MNEFMDYIKSFRWDDKIDYLSLNCKSPVIGIK
jgi:hypothetical protein